MEQKEIKKRIKKLEESSIRFFREEEIKKAVLTYKKIQFLSPKEEKYYLVYLSFLKDEFIIVEFAQDIYKEVLEMCNRAIQNLDNDKLLPFYEKKLENYIDLIDGSFGTWYENSSNSKEVDLFIEQVLKIHNQTPSILKRLDSLYRVTGKETVELNNLLNTVYKTLNKDDFQLMIFNIVDLEKQNNILGAIERIENYITHNNAEKNQLKILYSKLINLNTSIKNIDRADYYENILDNLD